MILKWDELWSSNSESYLATKNKLFKEKFFKDWKQRQERQRKKSIYLKMIEVFKSFKEGSVGRNQVKIMADQWLRDAYLGTNFRDFKIKSNLKHALESIFGVYLEDMSQEVIEIIDEHYPKRAGRPPKKRKKETQVEETQVEETEVEFAPYVELGDLKIYIEDRTSVVLNEVKLAHNKISIHGDIDVFIKRVVGSTLYRVEIKKKG